eukprot:5397695-Amphidinium_carterae.1
MSARPFSEAMCVNSKCDNKSLGFPAPGSRLRNRSVAIRSAGIPYNNCAASASRRHSLYAEWSPPKVLSFTL